MIVTTNLAKEYGARVLFADVSLQLNAGARYGLVGANGSGKTTFLKVLAGDEEASAGSVLIAKRARVGVLRQDRFLDDGELILDLAMRGDATVWNALAEQRRMTEARGDVDAQRMADLEDVIAAHDGYTLEGRASEVLEGLAIPTRFHRAPLATLSGGFKLRVLLAQVLVGGMDVLLLDEPTNHLDILTIRWLEKFLAGYAGCAVIISHDQRFLDNVTSHTLDVDYRTLTLYPGNYSKAIIEKAAVRARAETGVARAEDEIARKRVFVERFGAKNTKATQAQSRLKQIEKIEVEELVESSRRTPQFKVTQERPSGRDVLELKGVSKAYAEKRVLTDVSLTVRRGERVAVIGPNGLGKSTLLRIVVERLAADAGNVKWGHEVKVGYFPQDHRELLDDADATPLETLTALCPGESPTFVRSQLGRVLFSGDDVNKRVGLLSGGEAARLIFALLAVRKPNVLVLDEPTNHLDLEAIHALVDAVKAYPGTVVFVSHDRWFVSELATRVVELTPDGPRDFPGTYAEYLERLGDDHLDGDAVALRARQQKEKKTEGATPTAAVGGPGRNGDDPGSGGSGSSGSWEEQKKRRNRVAQLPTLRDKVLAEIEAAETRKAAIQTIYADAGFFQRASRDEIDALVKEQQDLGPKIEALVGQWEVLEREIAEGTG
ncbi:MAG: ABC-F family ATP-binding cassette domain-containing protein [Deltaproteobacteria bacterium]|nr:ABC-F family ATP-binding cassette domain-containing protein [Deltaproteobacteria bacterium]